jgi:hypothetical protein
MLTQWLLIMACNAEPVTIIQDHWLSMISKDSQPLAQYNTP